MSIFFFQAEDGIRDLTVTGVQTCALPISRYLLCCEGLQSTREHFAFSVFERTFKDYGLPRAIRSDKGVPFASTSAFFGLSKLSVWWLRLGIAIERIKPAHPEQNGRHERMHLTLKKEATKPAGKNFLQQQARFDAFTRVYNHERPHQALNMRYPAELYRPSARPYTRLPALEYPLHHPTVIVTQCGRLRLGRRKDRKSTRLNSSHSQISYAVFCL